MAANNATPSEGPIRLNLKQILSARSATRRIPAFIVRRLEKLICQDKLNEMLRVAYPRRGAEFCRAVLDHLNVKVEIEHAERLPSPSERLLYVSNHPLGGLDGMALIDWVTARHGVEPRFVVNDLLMAIEPLSDVFLPINKHGAQSRKSVVDIDAAMESDRPVIVFPAGLCSRRQGRSVADLKWNKMFVRQAIRWNRTVVPLRFCGENSGRFYRCASLREKVGIKFNIEMALLPSEVFRAAGKTFKVICGNPVSPADLDGDPGSHAASLRQYVIDLKSSDSQS
ncbi:MAG: 1-acyl-sn-glycerol-3-phosphate acyltransferase [Muribaculaceae bacterium]|nr:1-acyl-sn-glycerol-3-phosphate acyltransferase [Muribaculaceae bacterium]